VDYEPVQYEWGVPYSQFQWTCYDFQGLNMSAVTVTINVDFMNHAPIALNVSVGTIENQELAILYVAKISI
jgi:hypothetical protein